MRLTGNEDLRVRKTITAIRKAFEELICKKDYEQIKVSELCARSMVNKKTFYHYYPSLDALLAELQEELSSEYVGLSSAGGLGKGQPRFFRVFRFQRAGL